jgi:hypothetical protein
VEGTLSNNIQTIAAGKRIFIAALIIIAKKEI